MRLTLRGGIVDAEAGPQIRNEYVDEKTRFSEDLVGLYLINAIYHNELEFAQTAYPTGLSIP